MATTNVLANVLVKDWAAAQDFYATVFGRPADAVPMPGCAEWNVPAGGMLQVVENAERAGSSSVALVVDDLDARRTGLQAAGVDVPEPMTVPNSFRVMTFSDPEGTMVTLVETLAASAPATVRALFTAYLEQDAAAALDLLDEDFVVTSPRDEPIGRDEWLRRCFPTAARLRSQELVDVVEISPGEVFVRYADEPASGARHRNTEVLTVRNGRVVEVQVYFGAELP